MKKTKILFASLAASAMLFSACGDDEVCATCTDDSGESKLCAPTEAELDTMTDAFLNAATGTAVCISS